ncbi:hypothetical protein ATANTOWER_026848 [Ataeniobius toweri]|uniref:Uncharacterized protein n=1 Tax=Ataeniobius toweri TaxID=208326 RepID=A0ABU7BHT2_9TELE|nr:hypothetical protein [Ataeniobius toweri]
MDSDTEVCAEDFSTEDEDLIYLNKVNDELDYAVPPLERQKEESVRKAIVVEEDRDQNTARETAWEIKQVR